MGTMVLPVAASATLPDGRVYEQVSPPNKNGNYVVSGGTFVTEQAGYAAASADGESIVFLGSGAMGDASSSNLQPYVASRSPGSGWATTSTTPPQLGVTSLFGGPSALLPSADFSSFAFASGNTFSPEQPLLPGGGGSVNIYLSRNPFVAPEWIAKPTVEDPIPALGELVEHPYLLVGGSPSLSTLYFMYSGTLVAQDASRVPNVGNGQGRPEPAGAWGFYEWRDGALAPVGVLPNGTVSPLGAVPAAMAGDEVGLRQPIKISWQAEDFNGEVSADGSRAFFVSPDPVMATVSDPPELYVREAMPGGTKRTLLLSQSQLSGHLGEPAPTGATSVPDASTSIDVINASCCSIDKTDVFASADGSHAFFTSRDRLTEAAPEDTSVKEYDFDLETGALTYLPGVVGPIVASARNGSDFIFDNTVNGELDLWTGPGAGRLTTVAPLPGPEAGNLRGHLNIEARATANGGTFVFNTNAPVPGGFNNLGGYMQIYRYEVTSSQLTCVSCPPTGITPSGDARISYDNAGGTNSRPKSTGDSRVMSADGTKVFFDTPDPLIPQDTNGKRDVYEWEGGQDYLLSSGASSESSEGSFYLDNSESGNNVFFNTSVGLKPGDTDGAYDVYDARVPREGDNPPPPAAPCQGDVCQGPPSVPSVLGVPSTATFSGAGNLIPVAETGKPKPLTRAQKLARALRTCRKDRSKKKRLTCEAAARRRYGISKKPEHRISTKNGRAHR
jgi:hypothetical protein